jgi:hypothetical protein
MLADFTASAIWMIKEPLDLVKGGILVGTVTLVMMREIAVNKIDNVFEDVKKPVILMVYGVCC